jgi:SAM-dependent methyltransferase
VEIGCGCGRIAHHLRGDWFTGSYVGIDIDQEMLDWDSAHFPRDKFTFMKSPHKSVTYSATKTDQQSGVFAFPDSWKKDFVFSTSLYTHLLEPELRNYTSESYKILRDGGTMYMTVFCIDSMDLGNRWTFKNRMGEAYVESTKYPEAAVGYTREYLENLCRATGFKEITISRERSQSALICRK